MKSMQYISFTDDGYVYMYFCIDRNCHACISVNYQLKIVNDSPISRSWSMTKVLILYIYIYTLNIENLIKPVL